MNIPLSYAVYTGMRAPLTGETGWVLSETFDSRKAAQKLAKTLPLAMVQEVKIISLYEAGELKHGTQT